MAKKSGKKKNKGKKLLGKSTKTKGKKLPGKSTKTKGKKKNVAKRPQAIGLAALIKKMLKTNPRPYKILKEMYESLMKQYDRRGEQRPDYTIDRYWNENMKASHVSVIDTQKVEDNVDPQKWKALEKKHLGDFKESPIDIETSNVKRCSFKRITFDGVFDSHKETIICNNGLTVEGTLRGEAFISDGPFFGKYKLDKFRLNYGVSRNDGTLHTINGKRYALELHFEFHLDSCSGCPLKVLEVISSRATLSLLFKVSKEPSYYEMFSLIPHIMEEGKKMEVTDNLLSDFKGFMMSSDFYNYCGSCTTSNIPNVEWIIFKKVLPIKMSQMEALWELKNMEGPIIPQIIQNKSIGDRTVFKSSYHNQDCLNFGRKPVCTC